MTDTSNLKPGDKVRLKPLEECDPKQYPEISDPMHEFFGKVLTVEKTDCSRIRSYFWTREAGYYIFSPEWIAEVLPAEEPSKVPWVSYNPATHKLVPVADYVGPEEFAELKRKADCYDSVQDVCRATSRVVGIAFEDGSVMNFIRKLQTQSRQCRPKATMRDKLKPVPIAPTPGAPELEGVSNDALFMFTFGARSCGKMVWFCRNAYDLSEEYSDMLEAIEWHVGPFVPPEVQNG